MKNPITTSDWTRIAITVAVLALSYAALNANGFMASREILWLLLAITVPFLALAVILYRAFRRRAARNKTP